MEMNRRLRLLCALLDRTRTLDVDRKSPAQLERARRPLPRTRAVDLVTGRVPADVDVRDATVPTRAGDLPVRTYRPRVASGPRPLVVDLHGGGFVLGNLRQGEWHCSQVARSAGAVVVSVGYRLAPEHPYPAAREDALDAFDAVAGDPEAWGGAPAGRAQVSVMGDSAGGNLAAVVALMARDRARAHATAGAPGPPPPQAHRQLLVYPAVDLTDESPSHGLMPFAPVLPKTSRDAFLRAYLAGVPADRDDPYQSPLRAADHRDLPPALIVCAEHDPLTAEGRAYAAALRDADVPVRFVEHVGVPHGFLSFPGLSRAAPQAVADLAAFVRGDVPDLDLESRGSRLDSTAAASTGGAAVRQAAGRS